MERTNFNQRIVTNFDQETYFYFTGLLIPFLDHLS
jgi:hypothetical protein